MSDALRALLLAREAIESLTCGCVQVCGDTDCREVDHPHDSGIAEGCSTPHDCQCKPACAGYAPDVCEAAAKAHEALAAIKEALVPTTTGGRCPKCEEPEIRWSLPRVGQSVAGISQSGVVYGVALAACGGGDAYFWWAEEHGRSDRAQSHFGYAATEEAARQAAEEHARCQLPGNPPGVPVPVPQSSGCGRATGAGDFSTEGQP